MYKKFLTAMAVLLAVWSAAVPSPRAEEGSSTLALFEGEEEPVLSTSRVPRPVSRIAENVTVVTADQIALLNAHTLADVLQTIPGIQLQYTRTPGTWTDFFIQGAIGTDTHILLLIDGVQINTYVQGITDPGGIPVQQIDRIEIIKGAASPSWGPALGGVVNVITKSPENQRRLTGALSTSLGERSTSDTRGEASGTIGRLGYYLSGGTLHSDGLLPNNGINQNNGYLKLTYDLPTNGLLTLGASIRDNRQGMEEGWLLPWGIFVHDFGKIDSGYSFLSLDQPLAERTTLTINLRGSSRDSETTWGNIAGGTFVIDQAVSDRESAWGGSAKLSWGDSSTGVVGGFDYDHVNVHADITIPPTTTSFDRSFDRWGAYANGAFSLGRFTLLPGIRLDHTGIAGEYLSYNAGATFRVTEKTFLRAYGARGYGMPSLGLSENIQKVWTAQAGVESNDIPYLWLKGTLFYNRIWDVLIDANPSTFARQTKQGFEVEARTLSWQGISLSGGYTFTDARDADTHERLQGVPQHGAKLGLTYDDSRIGLKGIATGNYVWWRSPSIFEGRYTAITWDLHLTQKLPRLGYIEPEVFFSARNLFNGAQYSKLIFRNAPRWIEGGVRFRF
ncbi:TonB-dependent siderophore receptor [Geobacter sp. DSM 9736]|uniref:TonB-dependent receptor plug domain-containing protein n=1 Tax=Geobacter sp. DSM 9736 TaxID=1277350 RepID=UPI000B615210|nr:TonB-dependent receptor [Geobacter sp. DSM 9736]SNB48102.1 vitamin B12 transporter [Geobacter sp. DSM 9736]